MIELKNISKSFLKQEIFNEVNLIIPTGSKAFVRGINGSGKSVLLKIIAGYITPTSGQVTIDDEVLGENIDFIPNAGIFINSPEFMPKWTGWENLLYLAEIRGIATEESIRKLAKVLLIEDDLDKKYNTYSLGMRQKLRIIQALMDEPQYLILDEPFDALDKKSRGIALDLLNNYMEMDKSRTLVYTSHNESMEDFRDIIFEVEDYTVTKII